MNNKTRRGFTLIELLAIIVVLAIIALISTVVINKIIYEARKGAFTDSVKIAFNTIDNSMFVNDKLDVNKGIDVTDLELKSQLISGKFKKNNQGIIVADSITDGHFCASGPITNLTIVDDCSLLDDSYVINDSTPGNICGSNDELDYDEATICYINSVDDMVAFSNLVNSGHDFYDKTVELKTNLDFNLKASYSNKELYNTIKDNFMPIGNTNNDFKGNFNGNGYTIKNLKVNYPNQNYVGLFGNAINEIKNLNIVNADIEGHDYVGIIGHSYSIIGMNVQNVTVKGRNYVGLVSGDSFGADSINITGSNEVIGTGDYIGGVLGQGSDLQNIIIHDVVVEAPNNSPNVRLVGNINNYFYGVIERGSITGGIDSNLFTNSNNKNYLYTKDVKINGSSDGGNLPDEYINNMTLYDYYIDTYLGGDNDNNDFYFDHDEDGEFILKNKESYPFNITLNKNSDNEYLIYTPEDFKQMSLLSNEYSNKFRLMNDIDFTGKQYYIPNSSLLNREHYQTTFEASFDGNGYTLKNINIKGATNYTGLFGDARGTIRNLNVLNANIEGKDYVGIVGNANHIIGMNVKNVTVTGRNYVGLISGQSYGTLEIINVESDNKVIGTGDHIGGITGYSSRMANILVHGLDVQGPLTSENIALISPDICNNVTFIGIIENGTSSNTNIVTRYSYYNKYAVSTNISMPLDNRATSFDASYIGNMEYYKTLNILETIGVENAQDNCYFTNSGTVTCN